MSIFAEKDRPMHDKQIPEVAFLLKDVEQKYRRRIETTADFEALSVFIEHETDDLVSSSTLKRLWGVVSLNPTPRISTLDILSRFVGFQDFKAFCDDLKRRDAYSSRFLTDEHILSSDLTPGERIRVGWDPNRLVSLTYLGDNQFRVDESANSKLAEGDVFELISLVKGYPMFISRILREGEYISSYVAGLDGGVTVLQRG